MAGHSNAQIHQGNPSVASAYSASSRSSSSSSNIVSTTRSSSTNSSSAPTDYKVIDSKKPVTVHNHGRTERHDDPSPRYSGGY